MYPSKVERIIKRMSRVKRIGCYVSELPLTLKYRQVLYAKESFPDESWKSIEGSDGAFLISNHGRVKRIYKHVEPKFIMPVLRKQNGHLYVKVRFLGVYTAHKISHLVSHHFIGPNKLKLSVRHKNGIKTDCFAGNLEYMNKQQLGRLTGGKSTSRPVVQLCPNKMTPIEEYRSAREAGRKTFLSYQAVLDNCNGKTKIAGGVYKFMFVSDYDRELAGIG